MGTCRLDERWVEPVVWNNAVWCDMVCRSHGAASEFSEEIWICNPPTPPFYPNAITLVRDAVTEQRKSIQKMLADGLGYGWGIKDSYASLDLSDFGFQTLFHAEWILLPASDVLPVADLAGVYWRKITNEVELAHWELAWRGLPTHEMATIESRIFRPQLLNDPQVVFVAAYHRGQIVAGAIGNRTKEVVGVSNVFAPSVGSVRYIAGCVRELREAFPGTALAGYERGIDLEAMQELGFQRVGSLRVWVKEPPESTNKVV